MHRAMTSWSANHQYISFVDVTQECATLYGETRKNCSLIELWVTGRTQSGETVYGGENGLVQAMQ